MKTCTKCNKTKPKTEFAKDSQKKDGLRSSCKQCKKEYDSKYVAENKEKKYAANKLWNDAHKKEKAAYDAKRRAANREEINRKKREHYQNGGKETQQKWASNNKDKVRAYLHNAKAKRRELEKTSTLTATDIIKWAASQVKLCAYCGIDCSPNYHIDHIEPLSVDGTHSLDNLTIACPSCNLSKNNSQMLVWLARKHNLNINDK